MGIVAEGGELIERRGCSLGDALRVRVVITDKGETRKPDRRSMATPPRVSGGGARRSDRVTILISGLGGTKAECRKLPRQFTCGLAVPPALPTGPSAGADRAAHFHAAGGSAGQRPMNVYVGYPSVGSMFATGSKAGFELVGPELVRRVRADIPVPPVAIGGITRDNVGQVIETGADAVPVTSAVGNAGDPAAMRDFLEAIRSARSGAR